MSKCDKCKYPYDIWEWPCEDCLQGDRFEPKPPTNADRIRVMTDEELAEQLYLLRLDALRLEGYEGFIETKDEVLDWLKEEVDDGMDS